MPLSDAFHHRCYRSIVGIAPSFISRITNKEVRSRTGVSMLSTLLLKQQQLLLFGRVARMAGAVARDILFNEETCSRLGKGELDALAIAGGRDSQACNKGIHE